MSTHFKSRFVTNVSGPREETVIYKNPSCCENLVSWTESNCMSNLLGIFCMQIRDTEEAIQAKFRTINISFEQQPPDEKQNSHFDQFIYHVLCFVVTSSLRNATDSYQNYLKNKVKGMVRAIEKTGTLISADLDDHSHLVPTNAVLATIRDFLDRHPVIMKDLMTQVVSLSNMDDAIISSVSIYATEAINSVRYAYMMGVELIEKHIIAVDHPIIHHRAVASLLKMYHDHMKPVKDKYGDEWVFYAILDRPSWMKFQNEPCYETLWIYAAILGAREDSSMYQLVINRNNVTAYAGMPRYSKVIREYEDAAKGVAVPRTGMQRDEEVDMISNLLGGSISSNNSIMGINSSASSRRY